MGLFSKKKGEKKIPAKKDANMQEELPSLPELPKLPELPSFEDDFSQNTLPSLKSNSARGNFSQRKKEKSISGMKRGEEVSPANDFAVGDEMLMMQKPLGEKLTMAREIPETMGNVSLAREIPLEQRINLPRQEEIPYEFEQAHEKIKSTAPVFIRIDKFQESLKIFERAKEQVHEIEKLLRNIKSIKEEEEKELAEWGNEIKSIKAGIEKIDQDVFSKID